MLSFKGILKYALYLFIAAWMFVLGIMVGRGNSPVNFDTGRFQDRLEKIAAEFGKNKSEEKQMELKFYDVLEKPVTGQKDQVQKKSSEILPVEQKILVQEIKTSTKKRTFKAKMTAVKQNSVSPKKSGLEKQVKTIQTESGKIKPDEQSRQTSKGIYTIQIAAYKDFKDAVTQMAELESLGIKAFRQKAMKEGITWYRVRTGSFETLDAARQYKDKLTQKKIKGMIIKKAEP